jgi:tyrosyl-tRNA synthetase
MVSALLADLRWRGILEQCTPELESAELANSSLTGYAGFDPTASSLHLGNLVPVIGLMRLQRAGHRPIAVVGGATGLIGDPSGKASERPLLDAEMVRANAESIHRQLERFLDFSGPHGALMVNNLDWLGPMSFIGFLRDYGRHFRMGTMLGKESVRTRLEEREQGMSFTEFTYMLLQATDFLHLYDTLGCTLQVGGSDQWGNITAGIELIRRVRGASAHGLSYPLLLSASGAKFGKSEGGALYLDAQRTKPYSLYQYLVRTDDRDADKYLKMFTFLSADSIAELAAQTASKPEARAAQKALAWEVTALVHGEAEARACVRATEVLFGAPLDGLDEATLLSVFADVPSSEVPKGRLAEGTWSLVDALVDTGLCKSRGDARRRIEGGGVYVNNHRAESPNRMLSTDDLASPTALVLRLGKREYHLIRVQD